MATADRLEREAQRRNPWPYIDKALADERAKQPINLQPNEDFRGDELMRNRDLDVADTKRQLNRAANRAGTVDVDQRDSSGFDPASPGQDANPIDNYFNEQRVAGQSTAYEFLEQSRIITERENKLRSPGDISDFPELAAQIEEARQQGADITVDDVNNMIDWRKVNVASDKVAKLMIEDPDKNRLAIENVYKTLEMEDPKLAALVPDVVFQKVSDMATDPNIMETAISKALQGIDAILTPFIWANENVMQSVRGGVLQQQEAAQDGNGALGQLGAMLGGFVTRRDDVEKGDYNEEYIQSIRDAKDDEGNQLYTPLEVEIALKLSRLKATNPTASPWDIFADYANNPEAKAILGSMVSGVGPRAVNHAELLRQIDSAHLGNTGQMLFGAAIDEDYNVARGGETRQDVANVVGFGTSVVLDPTIVGSKVYRGVQAARYMLASLAPVSPGAVGARSILTKGPGFGPFRLNNKTYRFFDQLAKDLNNYEDLVKKADDLEAGSKAQVTAQNAADAARQRMARQYSQITDDLITDIFATVPRNAEGRITVDTIADYVDETNADYLATYVALEDEALKAGYAAHEVPRLVSWVLDEQNIRSFDQRLMQGNQLKRGDLTPQMTALGVLRKSVSNKISAELMPKQRALKILEDYVDTTNAESIAQSMSDNALEIGRSAQGFKRSRGEGFFDSTRRMFSSIMVDNIVDLADPASSMLVYRYTRMFLPQKVSETVANAWRNGDIGSRRLLLSSVVRAAAMSRGLTVTKAQADAFMGRVDELIEVTGKKTNEAYGQQVTRGSIPSRRLAQRQYDGLQGEPMDSAAGARAATGDISSGQVDVEGLDEWVASRIALDQRFRSNSEIGDEVVRLWRDEAEEIAANPNGPTALSARVVDSNFDNIATVTRDEYIEGVQYLYPNPAYADSILENAARIFDDQGRLRSKFGLNDSTMKDGTKPFSSSTIRGFDAMAHNLQAQLNEVLLLRALRSAHEEIGELYGGMSFDDFVTKVNRNTISADQVATSAEDAIAAMDRPFIEAVNTVIFRELYGLNPDDIIRLYRYKTGAVVDTDFVASRGYHTLDPDLARAFNVAFNNRSLLATDIAVRDLPHIYGVGGYYDELSVFIPESMGLEARVLSRTTGGADARRNMAYKAKPVEIPRESFPSGSPAGQLAEDLRQKGLVEWNSETQTLKVNPTLLNRIETLDNIEDLARFERLTGKYLLNSRGRPVSITGQTMGEARLSRPIDAVEPVRETRTTIRTKNEALDDLFDRLGGTEDDLFEGRISWDEANRVEQEILEEWRGQILDNRQLLDDFVDNYLGYGASQVDEVRDWWVQPVPGQPIQTGPSLPEELGSNAANTKTLQAEGTISRKALADIADAQGDEKALAWLYTGYTDNYLDDSLGIPATTPRLTDDLGRTIPGWRGIPEDWYSDLIVGVQRGRKTEYRIAVPWARGGSKGRAGDQADELDEIRSYYRDQAVDDARAGRYDRELEEYIVDNREVSRDVRWEPVPARQPVVNPGVMEPEPVPMTPEDAAKPVSLSSDASGVESALHVDQTSQYIRIPNLSEMEDMRVEMGPLGKAMYRGHKGVEWYTNFWSLGTLFGWRFSIRNAIEELGLWFLTAGGAAALARGRVASTARRRVAPDLFVKEVNGSVVPVWKSNLGPINRRIEKDRQIYSQAIFKRPEGDTLASWQAEWAEAKGIPGWFMRNVIIPVVAPRVGAQKLDEALVKLAQGETEEWSRLVMEGVVGYQLGGRSLASFGIMDDDSLEILEHLTNSTHGLALLESVTQSAAFLNSARNPSARGLFNSLDMDELPPGVLPGQLNEDLARETLKDFARRTGVRIDGFKPDAIASRRRVEDWHHLLRAVGQGDGVIGEEAIKGIFDISYGRATTVQVKARIAQAIRNDESGEYAARFSRLSSQEGIDQFASDYLEDVLAMFQRRDGSINTRLLDRFFDKEGNYLGWGRPRQTLDDGIVYEDRVTVGDLNGIPLDERPNELLVPNRSEREYIPFAASNPSFWDRAYMWMGRQNARLSKEPIFLGNVFMLWKASRGRREQVARALAKTRGRPLELSAEDTQAAVEARAQKIVAASGGKTTIEEAREQAMEETQGVLSDFREFSRKAANELEAKQTFDRAYDLSVAFMDNPLNRSNLAWKARNFSRYYRASEDFWRRMRRMAVSNPEGYAKAAIAYHLIEDSGFVYTDDYGDKYFAYPLNGIAQEIVQWPLRKIFGDDSMERLFESQPFSIGGKLLGLTPSADPLNAIPPFTSGYGQIPATLAFNFVPQFAGARALALGQYSQPTGSLMQDILTAAAPAGIRRILSLQDQDQVDGQIADATIKAVEVMMGWGYFDEVTIRSDEGVVTKIPLGDATEAQIQASEEMRAADIFGVGLMLSKLVGSFALPAYPQVKTDNVSEFARGMNIDSMDDAYYDWMDKVAYDEKYVELLEEAIDQEIYDPWNYAMAEWWALKVNDIIDGEDAADGGSFLPFTIGSYEYDDSPAAQRANFRATAETLDWFHSDEGFQRYPADLEGAALFLAPREGEWDANGHYVAKNLLQVRVKKQDDNRLRQLMDVEVSAQLGRIKLYYNDRRMELDPYSETYADDLRELDQAEQAERDMVKANNKRTNFAVFDIDRGTAVEAAEDMRRLIAWEREQAPDGDLAGTTVGWFAAALRVYDNSEQELAQYPSQTNFDRAQRNEIKARRDADLRSLMEIGPKVKNFVESVVIPMGE